MLALWSAVRRYAALVDESRAETLLEFLRREDDAATRQMALQAIRKIFFRAAPTTAQDRLVARLRELIETCLHADVVVDATMRALAANFCSRSFRGRRECERCSRTSRSSHRSARRSGVTGLKVDRPYRCASRLERARRFVRREQS